MESFVKTNPRILAIVFHLLFRSTLKAGRPSESEPFLFFSWYFGRDNNDFRCKFSWHQLNHFFLGQRVYVCSTFYGKNVWRRKRIQFDILKLYGAHSKDNEIF